ncbi:biopolymer transporter ExbB [Wohlfahrtiimonas chitiniclastica]|nr:biopolymer transporter ExbB [Wohlfahrtiimonas chitiniclastica]
MGFEHFIGQADMVSKVLFCILILMSVVSWLIIILKALQGLSERVRTKKFLKMFWSAKSVEDIDGYLAEHTPNNYHEILTDAGVHAVQRYQKTHGNSLRDSGSLSEVITRALSTKLDEIHLRCENGVTALAAVSATAPFVGLFGTVWGIYHALIEIGSTGAGTIDKVAGPVGEALIMTGVGLAVAIPAVLAHSWVTRRNQVTMGALDSFAFELLNLLGGDCSGCNNDCHDKAKKQGA